MTIAHQILSVKIPMPLFERFEELAEQQQREIGDIVVDFAADRLPIQDEVSAEIEVVLSEMEQAEDEAVKGHLDASLSPAQEARAEELRDTWNQRDLTEAERRESLLISDAYGTKVLLRSKALVILKQRGYDINEFLHTPPIA